MLPGMSVMVNWSIKSSHGARVALQQHPQVLSIHVQRSAYPVILYSDIAMRYYVCIYICVCVYINCLVSCWYLDAYVVPQCVTDCEHL